ncbi:uncharacterized protein LOC128874238 [Hylaeus volcanicus]|uniref:uncharacterized protein LOC128874238 n=1 Tax=Hylaeus volcanicus TaxID=313075 RepID=UPI0023B80C36|nr:uncharacterized protein LOC128874238 [Hylaeus volcanicus]
MAQPTQDMDISSSFTLNDNSSNNDSSKNLYNKEITMVERNQIKVKRIHNDSINISENYEHQECFDSHSNDVKTSQITFPWLIKFNKAMCSSVGSKNAQLLQRLISLYTQNILTSINTYCDKALHMKQLKNHINSTLTFFHFYWHDIKEYVSDYDTYLNAMSVLLGIYIDMELKTFRHAKDSSSIITKLISVLWIYLNNSEKHIFRVLLKLKHISKKYTKIYDPIFMKSFTCLRRSIESLTDIDYIRYLLILKMWKRMKENFKEKKEVNKIALTILGPCPPKIRDELSNIIPKPPTGHKNETLWLLQPNVFDLKTACNNFLAFEDAMSVQSKDSHLAKNLDLNNFEKSQITSSYDINYIDDCTINCELNRSKMNNSRSSHSFQNIVNCSKPANQIYSVKKRNKIKKYKKASKLKPGEIILIDLTEEKESLQVNKSKKKKSKRKLEWLKMTKKKYKVQKQIDEVKCRNQVEIADAHSTENFECFTDETCLKYLPISDNKVSESIESCSSLVEHEPLQDNTHYINSQNIHDYISSKRNKELKCMLQHKQCDICTLSLKQSDIQHNRVLSLLKFLNAVGQNIKEPKTILNLFKENREQNVMSSQHTFLSRSTTNESNETHTQGKEETFSQPKSSIETIFLSKECQNSIINTQSIKQELPTSTDCSATETDACCQNDCHSHDCRSMNTYSQVTESAKQKVSCDTHEWTCCSKKIEVKPFSCHNYSTYNTTKSEDTTQTTIGDNTTDKKSISDKNIMCMLSDLDKCMDVLNRIGEHIMTVHAEKQRSECLDKTDACSVSTTVSGNQIAKSSLGWTQNTNLLTNSEKLGRILELYGKKEFLNSCNCKDFHRGSNQESNVVSNDNCRKLMTSTSQPMELHSYEKDHVTFSENKLSESFFSSHIKSEFDQSIKEEDSENLEVMTDHPRKISGHKIAMITNNQAYTSESSAYDLKNTEDLNEDIRCESRLQSFSLKNDGIETHFTDEYENIDILDSILNGDMTMEDEQEILEDSQSSLISPINYDNSNNVLNCISEFFLQAEHTYRNEQKEKHITSDTENSITPLPEGSLGTTGILNSLLDFELTNMDSPPNDFMYSNVQTVNPRLIKKSFEGDIFSINDNISELNSHVEEMITIEENDKNDSHPQEKKKSCNNQNDSIDSRVNTVEFGLNSNKEDILEFPSLIKNISSFSSQSTILVNSGNASSELKESLPKYSLSDPADKLNNETVIEKSYIFQKEDTVQSFGDTINRVSPETYTSNEIPFNALMNCTSQRDNFSSSHKHTYVELRTSPFVMKQSSDSDLLSSTDLIPCNTVTQCELVKCENSLKPRNIQKNIQHNCKERQNHIMNHRIEITSQSRSSKRKVRYKKKIKKVEREEAPSSIVEHSQDELSLRCPQLTVINPLNRKDVQSTCELPLSSFHTSCRQKSPHTVCTSRNVYKQLKCVGIQQLRNMSPRKQQILLNFHGDSTTNTIFTEDSKLEKPQHNMEDNIWEDSSVLYKSVEKPRTLGNKTCFKFPKRKIKIDADITKVNLTTDKHVTEVSNNILIKSDIKCTLQNIDAQSSKFIKKQIVATLDEETPLKKRKVAPKFSSLEANAVICSVNQQEAQQKQFTSAKKGFICTNRRKNMVGEYT